jgi:hypothetical protein
MALLQSVSSANPVTRQFLNGLLETCPFATWFDGFYLTGDDADRMPKDVDNSARTKITRSLNEDPAQTTKTQTYVSITKKIVYARPSVDIALEKRGGTKRMASQLADNTYKEGVQTGYALNEMFIQGDDSVDAEDFDGLINLVDAGKILTDGLILPAGNYDKDIASQQQLAMEKFLATAIATKATDVIVNDTILARLITVGKALGYYDSIQQPGGRADTLVGIRLHAVGKGLSEAELLPFNLNVGGVANCSQFIWLRTGERMNVTAPTTAGVHGEYTGRSGSYYKNTIELDMAMGVEKVDALWLQKGWRISGAA